MLLATRYTMPLDLSESWVRVGTKTFGRLGNVRDGRPRILAVNYTSTNAGIFVHSVDGSGLEDTRPGEGVVLGVDDSNPRRAWSVVVTGTAELMTEDDVRKARASTEWIWRPDTGGVFLRVRALQITGNLYQR